MPTRLPGGKIFLEEENMGVYFPPDILIPSWVTVSNRETKFHVENAEQDSKTILTASSMPTWSSTDVEADAAAFRIAVLSSCDEKDRRAREA